MITTDKLRKWREASDAATPGPWWVNPDFHNPPMNERGDITEDNVCIVAADGTEVIHHVYYDGVHLVMRPEDSAFTALARTAVPQLLSALAAAEAECDRLKRRLACIEPVWDAALTWRRSLQDIVLGEEPLAESGSRGEPGTWSNLIVRRVDEALDTFAAKEGP